VKWKIAYLKVAPMPERGITGGINEALTNTAHL
jgi:hypothetical protein